MSFNLDHSSLCPVCRCQFKSPHHDKSLQLQLLSMNMRKTRRKESSSHVALPVYFSHRSLPNQISCYHFISSSIKSITSCLSYAQTEDVSGHLKLKQPSINLDFSSSLTSMLGPDYQSIRGVHRSRFKASIKANPIISNMLDI